MEQRVLKISFNKTGGTASKNGVNAKLTLPISWVREMGLTVDSREVTATLEDGVITIKPVGAK
ncbi:hypothetical protein Ami103574_02655 [Aminipila butyrica]|uniref:SpoVT-AbrB domain-containing protein n=1 Tax=Aminipila butyrica TaxID=433296 RepID=A0A858BTM0_9FIRM|nr:hypothetical protein [Aminipila butyrica]QIB68280.1 hypothetical protein Ami103574_02655 [Aminipila butyrica]